VTLYSEDFVFAHLIITTFAIWNLHLVDQSCEISELEPVQSIVPDLNIGCALRCCILVWAKHLKTCDKFQHHKELFELSTLNSGVS